MHRNLHAFITAFLLLTSASLLYAQTLPPPVSGKTSINQYLIYAEGNHTSMADSINFGVRVFDKAVLSGGLVGSNFYVGIGTGNTITSGIYSGNRISVTSGNTIGGNLAARNNAGVSFRVITVGSGNNQIGTTSPQAGGILQARGTAFVATSAGNTVQGPVYIQQPYTYSGPAPVRGAPVFKASLDMPTLPLLPDTNKFQAYGTKNVTTTTNLNPGNYRDLSLSGKNTITFNTPGVYVFKSIKTTGKNKFNFVIPANSTDNYRIYIHEDVDLGPMEVTINNAGADANGNFPLASRIYTEIHGKGSTVPGGNAFRIKDTARSVGISSSWAGTIYAPKGSIVIGSSNSTDSYTAFFGALWSKTKILIGNGVRVSYVPSSFVTSVIDPYYPPPNNGKVYEKIGSELTILSDNTSQGSSLSTDIFRIDETTDKVLIEVIAITPNDAALLTFLQSLGFDLVSSAPDNLVLTGYFPIANLTSLNGRTDIDYVRPLFEPLSNSGQVTTLGDTTMKSNAVRSRFGIEGNGVTVGILSDSYDTRGGAENDRQQGDVPSDLVVAREFPGLRSDEGRAMAQVVYDVAPQAKQVFRTGCISPLDLAQGIQQIALPPYNCKVIVDDITYITEPFMRDGFVAQAVNNVVANNGVTYFTAAGNFGSKSFEATFTPLTGATLPTGISGTAHNFGGTIQQKIHLKKGAYTIVLQWDNPFYSLGGNTGATVDLDIYLVKPDGSYFGFNRNNLTGDPFEVLPFTANEETDASLLVVRDGGTANVKFKYVVFRGEATIYNYPGASTIVGQGNAQNAMTVGAMLYGNVNNIVPDYPSVASFSSRGGTEVNGAVRQKPDLIGPNGVNTTVTLNSDPATNIDGDPYPNFFGTSAAAPHVAAAAALFIEGKRKFNLQPVITPAEVRDALTSTARDLHEAGFDFKSGYGAVQADGAMLTIANARPILLSLIPPAGLTPSNTAPFQLRVKGKYLNAKTKIYLRGTELPTAFVNTEELTTTISGSISDDPPIQLFNSAKSVSGLDGGLSESLFFFSTRQNVTVIADNKTKKFGEALPAFTATILVDGVPLEKSGVTLSDLKLDGTNLGFSTLATPTSGVANYSITPYRTVPLDPNKTLDAAILKKYYFTFLSGTLTIQKLQVKITPRSQTVTYGEYVGGIRYDYDFGTTAVVSTLLNDIDKAYKTNLAGNTLVVLNGVSLPLSAANTAVLNNMSIMASFQSVRNARKYFIQNGQMVPLTGTISVDQTKNERFLVDLPAQSLVNYSTNPASIYLVNTPPDNKARGLVGANALANGNAHAALPNGSLLPLVNGQLLSMVNGQLQAIVSGTLLALVNGSYVPAQDMVMHNGQLLAIINGTWMSITNGQILAVVNGENVRIDLSFQNGQLQAVINGQLPMSLVNGQLQAIVSGQLIALVNGQLQSVVNGQLMPLVNGQLEAVVNGQLQSVVNGQILAVVNGQLAVASYVVVQNGQILAMVNGQLQPVINGQLLSVVNGQLVAMVNGQLMAVINGQLTFVLFTNSQLQAVVNGQLQPLVNGQLEAVVNGVLQALDSYTIINGQLQASVNGQSYTMVNGQLQALINGQLQPLVNNNGGLSPMNNGNAAVVIDGDDLVLQNGALGGQFATNMITGLSVGMQKLIPGAFIDPNYDVSYGMGDVTILPAPVTVDADWKFIYENSPAPAQSFYSSTIRGLQYNDPQGLITGINYSLKPNYTGAPGVYVIYPSVPKLLYGNYYVAFLDTGRLYVDPFSKNAKKIVIQRECVRALTASEIAAYAPYGYRYQATYSYVNKNPTPVYIPKGPDNYLTIDAGGTFDNNLPEVFEPGTYYVYVLFSGQKMYWLVRSMDSDHKTAITSDVDSSAQKCAATTTGVSPGAIRDTLTKQTTTLVYPNPAHGRVSLQLPSTIDATNEVIIFDAAGKTYGKMSSKRIGDQLIELNVSSLPVGIYLARVKTKTGYHTMRFTKL
ncbi:S8 family serine peptidase [Flavisolibacter nicotianae]|uniref:S8 family serine peptidase n=1 Tax=Flavisolibacter nicotianae TaxID=2364882 RepID=UPI000EB02147|nr:S8 family serine peptidase [Flavisolibacter nicotianae]